MRPVAGKGLDLNKSKCELRHTKKKKRHVSRSYLIEFKMRPARLERATFCFVGKRATSELSTI